MCGGAVGGPSLAGVDLDKATVIQGQVTDGSEPVGGAFVRLLDSSGEFTAEVVTSATGQYRFFARPGRWTVRALSWRGNGSADVEAREGAATDAPIAVAKDDASA